MSNFLNSVSEHHNNLSEPTPPERGVSVGEQFLAWLLCAFVILLPLLAGGNELYLVSPETALLMAHLSVVGLLASWCIVRIDHWQWVKIPRPFVIGVIGFVMIGVIAVALSIDPYRSASRWLQMVLGVILVYVVADILRNEVSVRRMAWALLWGGAVVAAYGIEQGIFGLPNWLIQAQSNRAAPDVIAIVSQGRIFSTFLNVNAFAAFLAMVFPVGVYLIFRADRPGPKLLAGFLLFLIISALAMTGSKGGWGVALIVTVGAAVTVVKRGEWRRLATRVGLVALSSLLLVGFVWSVQPSEIESPLERFFSVTMGITQSAEGRWSYWQGATELIAEHPLFGTGPGTFATSYQQVQADGHYARYAHNVYLQMASEIGLVGLLVFLGVVAWMCRFVLRLGEHREFGRILLLGCGALLIHGLVDFSWEIPANQWLFFVMFGMILGLWRIEQGDAQLTVSTLRSGGRVVWAGTSVAVVVMLVFAIGRPYLSNGYLQSAIAASIADDTDEAIELASEAVRYGPRSSSARNFLATAYRRQWERNNDRSWLIMAREQHERAVELVPTIGRYHHEHGKTLWALGEEDVAIEAWRKAHQHYPVDPAMSVTLAQGLWMVGEDDEAVTVLHGMAKTESAYLAAGNPDILPFFDRHFLLAKIYDAQGEIGQAYMEYERIVALSERSPERIALGPLLAGRIAIEPKLWYAPRSYLEIGDLYRRQGMEDEALVAYQKALQLDANFEKVKKRIRTLQAEIDGKLG